MVTINSNDFLGMVNPKKPKMSLKDKYRVSVEKWIKVLESDQNNKYGERLMMAVENMNKCQDNYLESIDTKSNNTKK